jgi:methionyl-tRNA synthetase
LIGKDILTTHCVYWTTMLFSLGLELPKTIFAHGWWLIGETKMSKSLGNVINPLDLIENYGVDAVRFYLMREMVLGLDANFTSHSFIKCYNSDLANDFGNLLNRVSGLIQKNHDGKIPEPGELTQVEKVGIKVQADYLLDHVKSLISGFKIQEAVSLILSFVQALNKYMEAQAPWKLAKTDMKAANRVLYTAAEGLRIATLMLVPVMPEKTAQVLSILGAENTKPVWGQLKPGTVLKSHPPLFPRIDIEKSL